MISLLNKIDYLQQFFSQYNIFNKRISFLLAFSVPRYVRVNTLISSVEKVSSRLIEDGWTQLSFKKETGYEGFIEKVKNLSENEFILDFHLDFLMVFPSSAQFHEHDLLRNGSILLQEKVCY